MRCLRRRYGHMKIPRVGGTNPRGMSAAAINSELDKLDKLSGEINDALIAAGRGHETSSETWKRNPADDDLTLAYQTVSGRRRDLRIEMELRYGPGTPSRLPRGFGPRKW